ncbi:MAG: hypothetical protein QXG38_02645 [Candidatus Hadarchaeales archaeon]
MQIHIYEDPSSPTLDAEAIAKYLGENIGIEVDVRAPLLPEPEQLEEVARLAASARIKDPLKKSAFEPLPLEIDVEKKLFKDPSRRMIGISYDGLKLQGIFRKLLPEKELCLEHTHIIFTWRLPATWGDDGRYHLRVAVYGWPSLISTTGIVEAPAKPKDFYQLKQVYATAGTPLNEVVEKFRGRFIDYDDKRLTEVMKGYCMQAVFYHLFGEPFCNHPTCRLYNAHWQEEVITAQLGGKLCERHSKMLEELKKSADFRRFSL